VIIVVRFYVFFAETIAVGAIKDLVDLVANLSQSIKDAKTRELLLPLKELSIDAQRDAFRLEQEHAKEMTDLKNVHTKEMTDLHAVNLSLQRQINDHQKHTDNDSLRPIAAFNQKTGTWINPENSTHYCPRCWSENKFYPMQTLPALFKCSTCGCECANPDHKDIWEFRTPI